MNNESKRTLTIIAPCYNEARILPIFWEILRPIIDELDNKNAVKVLFVNNGSTDNSLEILASLRNSDPRIKYITLSRNFGYQGALDAGVRNSDSNLYCVIDADGEDPPELILEFIKAIDNGSDIAYGVRQSRQEPSYRSIFRKIFYRVVGLVSDDPFRLDTGEFSMFTNELKQAALSENNSFPFLRASLSRVGYIATGVPHDRRMRLGGKSSLNAIGMVNFAVGGLLSSSTFPLRLALYLLPLHLILMAGLGLMSLVTGSVSPLIVALYIANVLMMVQFAFVSVYLARTYKNGLHRPSSFVVDRLSAKE
jgi:dolichol-phosphate mannosyltransferase